MWSHLKNLAGVEDADRWIRRELERARIQVRTAPKSKGEVPYTIVGRIGQIVFRRAWTYWVVKGLVPLDIARVLYEDPMGKEDIRVEGHCTCPPPEPPWVSWYDMQGYKLVDLKEKQQFDEFIAKGRLGAECLEGRRFVERPEEGIGFVESYHIDSEVGLRIFADAVKSIRIPAAVAARAVEA